MKNILLVHGSAHDSSCWDKLIPQLEADKNVSVHTITLSGHGNNRVSHFRVSMSTYADDICGKLQSIGSPTIVVGHSMGGCAISMAAEKFPHLISRLIYLTAIVPDAEGRSMFANRALFSNEKLEASTRFSLTRGSLHFDPNLAKEYFYNTCSSVDRSRAARLLCYQPIRPYFSKMKWTQKNLGSVVKYFIECSEDKCLSIELQRSMQTNMKFDRVLTLQSDHSPFLSVPDQLAQGIMELAA